MKNRDTYIGGSEVAALVGVHPYLSAAAVWARKLGLAEETPENDMMLAGTLIQSSVFEMFRRRTNAITIASEIWNGHPVHPNVGGTQDYIVEIDGARAVVEVKCAFTWASAQGWKHAGEGVVPEHYTCQLAYYREICGIDRGYFAALVQGELKIVEAHHDAAGATLGRYLCERAQAFWNAHVATRIPPEFDGSDSAGSALVAAFPANDGNMRAATESEIELVERCRERARLRDVADAEYQRAMHALKSAIGTSDGLTLGDSDRVTWKADKRGRRIFRLGENEE